MANRQRYSFPTSSQLEHIAKCPASFWGNMEPLSHPALEKGGNTAADTGTKLHKCIEAGFSSDLKNNSPVHLRISERWRREKAMDMAFELDVSDLFQDSMLIINETFRRVGAVQTEYGWRSPAAGSNFLTECPLGMMSVGDDMRTVNSSSLDPYQGNDTILAGRADLICAFEHPHVFTIVDWKFGAHPVEYPENNMQLISLGVMSIANYSSKMAKPMFDIPIRLVLAYPTLEEIVVWEGNTYDIVLKFREKIVPIIDSKMIHANPATYKRANPGDHCVYCPKKHVCSGALNKGQFIATHLKEGM